MGEFYLFYCLLVLNLKSKEYSLGDKVNGIVSAMYDVRGGVDWGTGAITL